MSDYRSLKVWEKSHGLVLSVYKASNRFPPAERFGLTAQVRRTAVSIPSNIAEGCGRRGDGDLGRFLAIAIGSSHELEYQLLLARDLGYLGAPEYADTTAQLVEIGKMLSGLRQKVLPTRTVGSPRRKSATSS